MKVLSWNIYKDNKKIPEAIEFLKSVEADIICLQEFPVEHKKLLDELGMHIRIGDEVLSYKNHKKEDEKLYMVIASKHQIEHNGTIRHQNFYEDISELDNRYEDFKADSFYVDVTVDSKKFRFFNVHFKCVAGPFHRLSQFKEVVENLSGSRHNVICGDMNSFGKPLINIFVWKYFGYRLSEIHINEQKMFNTLFSIYKFQNPFKHWRTFIKFPVQLDYILIPTGFVVTNKRRHRLRGSDHFPISVVFEAK